MTNYLRNPDFLILRTQIGIADHQVLSRAGLQHLLSNSAVVKLSFEASDESELWTALQEHQPDILIIDYDQSPHFSLATIKKLQQSYPALRLLIISDDDDQQQIYRVLESGIQRYITKACSEQEVQNAIQAAIANEKFFCDKVLEFLLDRSLDNESPQPDLSQLSAREREIIQLIAKGMVAKEIAQELHLSVHTIYTHRKHILRKLKLNSSSELLAFALKYG